MQEMQRQVTTERININLGGESKISIDSLVNTLEATRRSLRELANNLYDSKTTEIEIYVEPFRRGSFDIDIAVKIATIGAAMFPIVIPLGKAFIKTILVRKKTKGQDVPVTHQPSNDIYIIHTGTGDINLSGAVFNAMTNKTAYEKRDSSSFQKIR